jgi:hypothetical protein
MGKLGMCKLLRIHAREFPTPGLREHREKVQKDRWTVILLLECRFAEEVFPSRIPVPV